MFWSAAIQPSQRSVWMAGEYVKAQPVKMTAEWCGNTFFIQETKILEYFLNGFTSTSHAERLSLVTTGIRKFYSAQKCAITFTCELNVAACVHISKCLVFHYLLHNLLFSHKMMTFENPKHCSESSSESTTVCIATALFIALFTKLRKKKKVTSDGNSSSLHVCPSSDCAYSRSANEKPK